ncbi:uncharacterized protein K489DRAFT_321796 [Dissoconium aciculare CBS 342.82]|uniref:Queuosine 5'-phosphate N-glycosylase/hydrolase n=1 Tax=Dissoconium aciculare CBS 342.82 TaxID=1314786 RepID=A0A6J3M4F9_9PEZI|nr:uncharacterized protein K489DRAFT_321796 [Dissoconium aciculare CBS 342.82]KAF1821797.1 hypothetical protein K489DRAFT_321796 [Dissoconium aciculare CBS 342.82]
MSDDELDLELLALLRQSLGIKDKTDEISRDTGILDDARYIYNNAIDVSISMYGTKDAAAVLNSKMRERSYSFDDWTKLELHPRLSDGFDEIDVINFVWTLDLLNFSFWSDLPEDERFQVDYRNQRWTGYNSLVACLRRALDAQIPITTPRFWQDRRCTDDLLRHIFRSATHEEMPLLDERITILRQTSLQLSKVCLLEPDYAVCRVIEAAQGSAGKLVNLLAKHFSAFHDDARFEGRRVRFLKRAQIFVADVWAALRGAGRVAFDDVDQLTMFADYRVPQMLQSLGVMVYSPPLEHHIRDRKQIAVGHSWELELRGCAIWAIELIRREIVRQHPAANVNAVLLDFFLYDLAKEREASAALPHHRTRSIRY